MKDNRVERLFQKVLNIGRHRRFAAMGIAAIIVITCGNNNINNTFDAILDLYEQYDVIHIGERHWNMTDFHFRVSLVKYPRFAETVDDIIIESGNYLYQDILDRFVLDLEDVPKSELQKVWRNTVVPTGVWDATIYKDFIHEVRKVNKRLPAEKRIRLIAAEPPIDWSKVNTAQEWWAYLAQRSTHTPEVIKSEVIDKRRKALVIYGGAHFYRSSKEVDVPGRLRTNLEALISQPVFTILPLGGVDAYSREFQEAVAHDDYPLFVNLKISEYSRLRGDLFFEEASGVLGEFTDGVLYLGPGPDCEAEYDPEAASDSSYQVEFERRRSIVEEW